MIYTAQYLIDKRKEKWNSNSIELRLDEDIKFREAVANELIRNEDLRNQIIKNPEYLVELEFVIVDKNQNTVPFFLNEVQQDFILTINKAKADYDEGKITSIKLNVLKGRQQGFTSLITAYQLACALLNKNFSGYTLSDKGDNSEAIFQNKAKFPYDRLPERLKFTEKFNNRRQLLFEKTNSNWSVDTATKEVGRSKTINFFHGSECAFWQNGMQSIQAALGEAFTKNCIEIYESTANGFNDFQKVWKDGNSINCFYEWWRTPEYRLNFESEDIRKQFLEKIETVDEWIYKRLKVLKDEKHLEESQLYWYFKKWQGYIDKRLIQQEYPCSPEEAFLTSGNCYFNVENILNRLQSIKEPIKRGYFEYVYDEHTEKIKSYKWVDDSNGFIKIYEDVIPRVPYVLGGDTAGEGSDYFTGHVINNMTGKQVAVLRQEFNEIEYTRQIYCLGMYYNEALIGLETNFSTYPTNKLDELRYKNLFVREVVDNYTNKTVQSFGFKTTSATRPFILGQLQTIFLEEIGKISDSDTLDESLTFVKNEKGRAEAQEGCHDDLIMGLAIAYFIRSQQKFTLLPPPKVNSTETTFKSSTFDIKKSSISYGYGDEIIPV